MVRESRSANRVGEFAAGAGANISYNEGSGDDGGER